jgi:hypothetical protein
MFTRTVDGERRADMQLMATRIGLRIATCVLAVAAVTGTPTASADPDVTLPTMQLTGGGPIIGVGDEAAQRRIAMQLTSLDSPDVEQADGPDAAEFITTAAASISPRLASAFAPLQRVLGCQNDNAFGARAYRRNDGQWGGAMLVIEKSSTSNLDALTNCVKSVWPAPTAGGPAAMCASGWTYPTSGENHRPETYYILLAGTAADFCNSSNANYANYATRWP